MPKKGENRWSFEVLPPPIPEKDIKNTIDTDVVVVGAGTAGMPAALSAMQAGAGVILIDKHTTFRWGGGDSSAIGSRLQKQLGIEVDKDEVVLQLMKYGANRPDQRIIRLWAENSGAIMDWLLDMLDDAGIEVSMFQWPRPAGFDSRTEYYPEYPTCHYWHTNRPYEGLAKSVKDNVAKSGTGFFLNQGLMLKCLEGNFLKSGGDLRYQTRAIQLVRKGKGRVTGVIARDKDGDYIRFNARRAVVLCTGDYGNNPEMMQKYCPMAADIAADKKRNEYMLYTKDLREAKEPLNVGDGHQMAMWIGAVMEPAPHAPMSHTLGILGTDSFLHVNIKGERYENEDVPARSLTNSLDLQPEGKAWQVFDSKWEEEIPRMGVGLGKVYEVTDTARLVVASNALKADTIEELAVKMKVPSDAFRTTVDRYNELARLGKDLDFGKRADRLTTIDKPPYYAGRMTQHFLVVLGGLNTNTRLQPLDADWAVIPGLYLAGNTVGRFFAVDYPTMCPGLSHGMAWTTGRLAGLNAAAEVPHKEE